MPKDYITYLKKNQQIEEDEPDKILKAIKDIEKLLFDLLVEFLGTLDTEKGKLVSTKKSAHNKKQIRILQKDFLGVLFGENYTNIIDDLLLNFDDIAENNIKIHKNLNDLTVPKTLVNEHKKNVIEAALFQLKGEGLRMDFVQPIINTMIRRAALGSSLSDVAKELEHFYLTQDDGTGTIKQSRISRYLVQTTRDAIRTVDGTIHQAVAETYGLNAYRVVNSLISTSSGQCAKAVEKRIWLKKDIEKDLLQWTKDNYGKTYKYKDQPYSGNSYRVSKLKDGTTVENLPSKGLHFGCRHSFIPTYVRKGNAKEDRENKEILTQ